MRTPDAATPRKPTDSEILAFVPWHCYECGGQEYAEEQAREQLERAEAERADA